MKRTPSGIFRNYWATALTPLAILNVAPSTQAQTTAETHQVLALGQAVELRSQAPIQPHPQSSEISKSFSFSSLQADFLDPAETDNLQTRPSAPIQTANSRFSLRSSLPSGRSSQTLFAQNSSDAAPTSGTPDIPDYLQNQKPHRVFIGPEVFYRNYNEERITPDFKSFEYGFLYGVKLQYDYVKRNSIYFGADFRYDRGQTSYSGGLQDAAGNLLAPYNSKTNNEFINLEGRLGYTFKADKVGRLLLTPFVGYGYQQWNRNLTGDGEIPGFGPFQTTAFSEDYSWSYLAGGLRAEYRPSRRFTVGMNFKLMGMVNGNLDLQLLGQSETLDLGERIQAEVEFPVTYHIVERPKSSIDVRFTPFYRSQNIGRGNPGIIGLEPASTSDTYGATFGVVFGF
jgi:hypothetical protein